MSSISFTSICALEKSWYITTLSNVRLWFLKTLANYFHSKRDIGIIRISLLSIQLPLTFHWLPSPFLFSPLFTFLLLLNSSPFSFPLPLLLSFPFSFPLPDSVPNLPYTHSTSATCPCSYPSYSSSYSLLSSFSGSPFLSSHTPLFSLSLISFSPSLISH